nr:nucleoprotein [Nairobi sheep disease virus]
MQNQIVADNKDAILAWHKTYSEKHRLKSVLTNSASFCEVIPDLSGYEVSMRLVSSESEKDSVYASALVAATKFCAPILECAWTSCTGMVERGLDWFENNKETVKIWDAEYGKLRTEVPSPEQLLGYQRAALKWRKDTKYGINRNTAALAAAIATEYRVPGSIVVNVKDMLSDMIRRRNKILNRDGSEDVPKRGPVSKEHIDWARDLAQGKFLVVFNPPWGDINKAGKSGIALAATGMAKLIELDGPKIAEDLRESLKGLVAWINAHKDEVENGKEVVDGLTKHLQKALELAKQSSAMRAQGAQIDTVFSSYYWLWKAGVTAEMFPTVSQFLFELGKVPRGNKKMKKALSSMPLKWGKKLLALFADDSFTANRIYMHPGVLTAGRMSELGVCFGAIPVANPDDAAEGSGHIKNILNYKTDTQAGNPCAQNIVALFNIQKAGFDIESMDIVASEHLLHQSLVGERSPFQNAYNIRGNATSIQII